MQPIDYRTPEFLRGHIRGITDFYLPRVLDRRAGGYFGGLRDDGSIYDSSTRHLVDTCRHIHNFAMAGQLFDDASLLDAARHGFDFLDTAHRLPGGGFAWILRDRTVTDATRHCYGHAFVLVAAAAAHRAGLDGASGLIDEVAGILDTRFFEPSHGLHVDQIAGDDWSAVDPYRGQNANMHACEAMLAAFETTRDGAFLDRAALLAERVCVSLASLTDGYVWEHFNEDWTPDWEYNRDDPKNLFRAYGFLPGHFLEWSKLLVLLHRARPEDWMLNRARHLFDAAVRTGWDAERGGFDYSFDRGGRVLDTDRYYWVLSEGIGAAALLGAAGDAAAWDWYDRFWAWSLAHLVDGERGGWYRIVDRCGRTYDDLKSPPAKADYHPVAACLAALTAIGAA